MNKIYKFLKIQIFIVFVACNSVSEISTQDCKAANTNFAVVELFTSEGCSDCPLADKVLIELSKVDSKKNLYPLAFHVTYWDYIGWKDPFGKKEFTERQEKYSTILHTGNYTPQVVLNGKIDIVGSRRKELLSSIATELATNSGSEIELRIIRKGNTIDINYKVFCSNPNQLINFAIIEKGISSTVTRGENRGTTLLHENVVRNFHSILLTKNSGTVKLEFTGIEKNPTNFELISYTQDNTTFAITGANRKKLN